MSTAQLIGTAEGARPRPVLALRARARAALSLPYVLATALLLLVLYAAFAHGAVSLAAQARVEVAITAVAAVAGAGLLWTGELRFAASRLALAGVAALAAFAVWTGVTVFWSVAADQTWIELNRAVGYVVLLTLAIAIGHSHTRSVAYVAFGYLGVALALTIYGLGQKVLPGLHVSGVFNLNQTGPLPRLQEPLGYWNALAILVAMAVPIGLATAVDPARPLRFRLGALVATQLMLLVVAFTYSRGGMLALGVALIVAVSIASRRLGWVVWLAAALVAIVPALVFDLTSHSLTAAGVSLGDREAAGAELGAILIVSVAALVLGGRKLIALEGRVRIDEARARTIRLVAVAAVAVALFGGVVAVSLSSRGLGGTVSHAWHSFTTTRATSNYNPSRLLSADSENRWVWWKEAAGAFSDRPVGGWGAGSFGVVHLLYRRDTLTVQQPHSVPLQFLAETGIIGGVLGLGAFALLLTAGFRSARRARPREGPYLAAAVAGATVAYCVHSLYDWDWDIPAVTFSALLLFGVLIGAGVGRRARDPVPGPGVGTRALALGAASLLLCVIALSAALPSFAQSKAAAALVTAASASPADLNHAQSTAALAGSLDPFSDAGLLVDGTVAIHRRDYAGARRYLVEAVGRDPEDVQAWGQLLYVELAQHDNAAALASARRIISLNPRGAIPFPLREAEFNSAPPAASPTAAATPLPAR